jgi:TolA-binding protein
MSTSRKGRGNSEDLLVLARRGDLPKTQQTELEHALDTSASLQAAFTVGNDFDRLATVRPGDDDLIARAASKALGKRVSERPPGIRGARRPVLARKLAWAVGIAAMFAVSVAAGWTGIVHPMLRARAEAYAPHTLAGGDPFQATSRVTSPVAGRAPASATEAPLASASPAEELTVAAPTPPLDLAPPAPLPSSRPPAHVEITPAPATAANLFRRAGAARRDGDYPGARDLYLQLQRAFPESDEARLSHVSMGTLLLAAGKAAEADQQLSQYLSSGGGALAEEAMAGRARCLELLGRADDERQVWGELLRVFPSSLYATRAKQRLAQLAPRTP